MSKESSGCIGLEKLEHHRLVHFAFLLRLFTSGAEAEGGEPHHLS